MYHYEIVLTGENNPTITIYADGFFELDGNKVFFVNVEQKKHALLTLSSFEWKAIQNLTLMKKAQVEFMESERSVTPRL